MFAAVERLQRAGVLGLNQRNIDFIAKYNPRVLYPLVDDKIRTKRLAQDAGLAVPELYQIVAHQFQVKALTTLSDLKSGFALKPAHGGGGEGIIIVDRPIREKYRLSNGTIIDQEELDYHVLMILSGVYSLGGHPDSALIEYRVTFDPIFEPISYLGVPDIRIIVFFGVPVMAMIRLPTRRSDGKANLHQGAIGAGIDIGSGQTSTAVYGSEIVEEHPDTTNSVVGLEIPRWQSLLELAAQSYELTGLPYQGVDIVIDRYKGPLLLELNARPGLSIQIANRAGLLPRLRLVEAKKDSLKTLVDRVEFAKENFGY